MSLSAMFAFGARNFHSRHTWQEKLHQKMELIYGKLSGACVMGII